MSTAAELLEIARLLAELNDPENNIADVLVAISNKWPESFSIGLLSVLQGNKLLSSLAKVLSAKFDMWKDDFPVWVENLLSEIVIYGYEDNLFPIIEVQPLIAALRKYVIGNYASSDATPAFTVLPCFSYAKQILLADQEVYDMLTTNLNEHTTLFFYNAMDNCAPWQLRVLQDKQLIPNLIATLGISGLWEFFAVAALHSDAKLLLPCENIMEAAKTTAALLAINTYALLCSDKDLTSFEIPASWLETHTKLLESLLDTGIAQHSTNTVISFFSLPMLVLPIANLSVAEAYKGTLGAKTIKMLLGIVVGEFVDVGASRIDLPHSKQEAARALWNLAFLESNRALIAENNGLQKLQIVKNQTGDGILKKNIDGILFLCLRVNLPTTLPAVKFGHIMISYNWDNQPLITKIAQSLKERGYSIWLDSEQMSGSTLESMTKAVERAELILICMSQKYKDSPNCRLEGEYCVNRKVSFVPLMMQKGYSPDGWLDIVLGSIPYFDFTDEAGWDAKIEGLAKAIGNRAFSQHATPSSALIQPSADKQRLSLWTSEDLLRWMKAENIEQHYGTFNKHNFGGAVLIELKTLMTQQNSHYFAFADFKAVLSVMGIEGYSDILKISAAIRKL